MRERERESENGSGRGEGERGARGEVAHQVPPNPLNAE